MPKAVNGLKLCTKCQKIKSISEFGYRKAAIDNLLSGCKTCMDKLAKNYRDSNRQMLKEVNKKSSLKTKVRVTELSDTLYSEINLKTVKICTRCGRSKPKSFFYRDSYRKDGFNGICTLCSSERKRYHYYKNHEKTKTLFRALYKKDIEKSRKIARDWYHNNLEKCRARCKAYREKYPSKFNEYAATRKAMKKCATPKWVDRSELREIYKFSREESLRLGVMYTVDHIIPLVNDVVCGLHVPWNLRVIHYKENYSKSNKFSNELLESIMSGLERD